MKKPAIFLMGPTASGKTDLAVKLVREFPLDIISVDSAMIYRGMDVGTAKPDESTINRAPHRLVDILDPDEVYSAARFREDALACMHEITLGGRIPLLVGGTMLYFRALENGLANMPEANSALRAEITARIENEGVTALHAELSRLDPVAGARIDGNDAQRIQRALEVHYLTGISITAHHAAEKETEFPFRLLKMVLAPSDRAVLHERIAMRFDAMLRNGFLDELRKLRELPGVHADLPAMRAVGYRQAWAHLDGEYDHEEFRRKGIVATRRYAKRQMTWMRREANTTWIDAEDPERDAVARDLIRNFINKNK